MKVKFGVRAPLPTLAKTVALLIAVVFLTIVTFGAAVPLAIAAGVASAGLSIYGAYEAIKSYQEQNAANDVGLLTNNPSLVWVVVAIIGAAVDLGALTSALKAASKISEATLLFNKTKDVVALEKQLATIEGLNAKIQANILKQARIQEQEAKLLKGFADARKLTFVTIPGLAQTGELLARAIFVIRKGIVSFDSFIAELRAAKLISETGLKADELLLLKETFTKAKTLAKDDKLAIEIDKAIVEGDFVKVKELLDEVVKGAGNYIKFLDDPVRATQFADEIIDINRATEGGGTLLSGTPSSAINTASYYSTVPEEGASIFKTIIKNHMFADGNKRTAVNMFKSFCSKSGIKTSLTDAQMMEVATKVATNQIDDVLEISQQLIK